MKYNISSLKKKKQERNKIKTDIYNSNIKGIGMLIFTDLVVPFEILSIVLLSTLMGAIYMAKGDGTQ